VTEAYTPWLTTQPEEAVIEARVGQGREADARRAPQRRSQQILGALRSSGYEPVMRIKDLTYHEGGPLPTWVPPEEKS
jgi:hypothetical protein